MKDEILGVWVSKYALTEGISYQRVRVCGGGIVNQIKPDGSSGWGYFHPGDWHESRDQAVVKSEAMRQRKIASVKKQLAKLEALSFELAAGETTSNAA